ncbi:Putative colanic biosynthesis UDP-glucose lipid carrier transferase [Psychrobacter phenylpyruvicus]|uniref:Colanic biosynthesis UDP-glucose lipid carrier transferase n=4 Tax=Psychrobacter phenylpyruvicus TaxID=29432 RepID=A0A379LSB3_9GAMM|nr:Putative colanic biosynthesis UDP-glucose lipid carrier transferase [Psychrobacter phenylpyruvicus]
MRFLPVQLILGLALCTFLPFIGSGLDVINQIFYTGGYVNLVLSTLLVCTTLITLNSIQRFPGITSSTYIVPVIIFWFLLILFIVKFSGTSYSLYYYCFSSLLLLIYAFFIDIINRKYENYNFAYIPVGRAKLIPEQIPTVSWMPLSTPQLDEEVNGIVTDLHSEELTDDWERFITDKTLQGTPVYHYRNIRESLTGRVRINHMYENELGSLQPSPNYIFLKYCFDILLIIASLPFTLIICIITAIAIKLEDGGKVFYIQPRVGYRGEVFQVYKFRSMREKAEEVLTTENDNRITRVGKFIRKTRIDELPQFINVIKGEMSLIGPRAEFLDFAVELEKEVPFFNYRHIVKPGISGWAQVNQGYATGPEETKIKIEYDFYYIKHISFSLDLLIFFKTIHTMLTGFGAR